MVPGDLIKAGEWDKIEALTREAVQTMLGFELAHVGVNAENEEEAMKAAKEAMIKALAAKDSAYNAAREVSVREAMAKDSSEKVIFESLKMDAKVASEKAADLDLVAQVEASKAAAKEAELKASLAKVAAEEAAARAAKFKNPEDETSLPEQKKEGKVKALLGKIKLPFGKKEGK